MKNKKAKTNHCRGEKQVREKLGTQYLKKKTNICDKNKMMMKCYYFTGRFEVKSFC